ncbi:putative late blight resistance protein homolog R1A-3 [Salvia hispanica]|uniref:putative late blight resistance protein homolog R1A-3 n=1 Tax=Salvia hispanica TaxID=49212 RepID=UPI0020099BC1|nr:putative late blight resistance protein homolog R1A-3 [Salvia hispanica]
MAYAALVSLENTIHRFLNSDLFSISVEEEQQITSLREYVTPIRDFLEVFPDESTSWDEQMRELANAAEDILDYLVLEKVYLPCEEESESHPSGNHRLHLTEVVEETIPKVETLVMFEEEYPDDARADGLNGRIMKMRTEFIDIYKFYDWEKTYRRFREKWRFFPAVCTKFKSKIQFIHHLNKTRNDIDSIMEKVVAIVNDSNRATSSPALAPVDDIVGFPQDDADASECHRSAKHELQLEKVMDEIALISAEVKNIKVCSSSKEVQRGADSSSLSSSSTAPPIHKNSLVGFEDHVMNIKDLLCGEQSKLQVIPVCGMGGIGKTTLARNAYDDQLIKEKFDIRVWITVSQDYSAQRILSGLLESLEEYNNQSGKEESADIKVYQILIGRKYLVVMDDIWRSEAWDIVRNVFPDNGDGSRIMLTTRLYDVASYPGPSITPYELGLLNEVQSWSLLKEKVFANQECPSDLENIGKDIARSCKGLPLAIAVIAGILSTVTKNPASWLEIAGTLKSAKTAEQEHIEEILSLSYVELPQLLRPCFLYMGSFPEDQEIYASKLIGLWIAEGFLKFPINTKTFEEVAEECLEELVKRNLVFVAKRKSDGRIKSCGLHDLIRELCIRKAQESKFFLNLVDEDIEKEKFMESIKNERRVSMSYLSLFSSYGGSTIHSIKCSKYNLVKLDFVEGVRLVRVLDAEPADVESLPSQLFDLFHLRYLAIRYHRNISSILSKLKNLQTLIIRAVKRSTDGFVISNDMMVPWCMQELRHVYFSGVIQFDDPGETCSLENLQTVSYVVSVCCSEQFLKKIPNLKKLKISCDDFYGGDQDCLNGLVHLHQLENLEVYSDGSVGLSYNLAFPEKLTRLTLRDLKLPWNDMIVVGSLPKLQVLKLKGCTCNGGTWETTEGTFPVLEVLLVERSRFENWITESGHFPRLRCLLLHSCRDLNEIPTDIGEIPTLQLIEVKGNVKESLLKSAEVIREEQEEMGNNTLQVVCIATSSTQQSYYYSDEVL